MLSSCSFRAKQLSPCRHKGLGFRVYTYSFWKSVYRSGSCGLHVALMQSLHRARHMCLLGVL